MNLAIPNLKHSQFGLQYIFEDSGMYYPMFKKEDVNRDMFFHLRAQLVRLGCPKDEILQIAKKICMEVLQINNEKEYLRYILENTYYKCKKNINTGYIHYPIQDIQDPNYSHISLFSSIYGFEIEYLKLNGIKHGIADIGCGEGIFIKLAQDNNIDVDGYEIKLPLFSHDVKIHIIEDYYDIKKPYQCLIYNHVLEHSQIRPDAYLRLVMEHFERNMKDNKLKSIIVSLPLHTDITSHLVSKHQWVCAEESNFDLKLKNLCLQNDLKIFHPTSLFLDVARDYNYRLIVYNNLGIYVFEKYES